MLLTKTVLEDIYTIRLLKYEATQCRISNRSSFHNCAAVIVQEYLKCSERLNGGFNRLFILDLVHGWDPHREIRVRGIYCTVRSYLFLILQSGKYQALRLFFFQKKNKHYRVCVSQWLLWLFVITFVNYIADVCRFRQYFLLPGKFRFKLRT